VRVLRQAAGNQSEAARILGVSRETIWKRIKKYGIKTIEVSESA
jgi:transcriptional regulator of acetoin/glycerol metabolism